VVEQVAGPRFRAHHIPTHRARPGLAALEGDDEPAVQERLLEGEKVDGGVD
jgi:hypothetical protein